MGGKCVTALWMCLTTILTAIIAVSVLSPVWFQNEQKMGRKVTANNQHFDILTFGLLRYCKRYELDDVMFKCKFYDILNSIPSIAWIVSSAFLFIGEVLFILCLISSIFGLCMGRKNGCRFRAGLAYIQGVGVLFLSVGVLLYPFGLNTPLAHDVCGPKSNMYNPGDCRIAWGYILVIMAVLLTVFCPVLAKLSSDATENCIGSIYDSKIDLVSVSQSSTTKVVTTV